MPINNSIAKSEKKKELIGKPVSSFCLSAINDFSDFYHKDLITIMQVKRIIYGLCTLFLPPFGGEGRGGASHL